MSLRGLSILLALTVLAGCGGPEGDRADVRGASLQLDRPAGKQYDGGLRSPAQELMLLLILGESGSPTDPVGSSPDPLPGKVTREGSSPDPLPGLCNNEGDCVRPRD